MGNSYRIAPTSAVSQQPVGRSRARKRAKGAAKHVRSWPLRPYAGQCRQIEVRFFTGVRVFNAVLGDFIARSRAVKVDPAAAHTRKLAEELADLQARLQAELAFISGEIIDAPALVAPLTRADATIDQPGQTNPK